MTLVVPGGNDNHCAEFLSMMRIPTSEGNVINFAEMFPKYGVILLMQETSAEELHDLSSELPTDTHRVVFRHPSGAVSCDAVRSHSMADIFDAYHDSGLRVISITNGFGNIKPKLFNDSKKSK